MVAGDGRDDEVIFRWANELQREGTVKNVTTVCLGSRNTEAGCTLTQGVTGMSPHFSTLYFMIYAWLKLSLNRANVQQASSQSFRNLQCSHDHHCMIYKQQ